MFPERNSKSGRTAAPLLPREHGGYHRSLASRTIALFLPSKINFYYYAYSVLRRAYSVIVGGSGTRSVFNLLADLSDLTGRLEIAEFYFGRDGRRVRPSVRP